MRLFRIILAAALAAGVPAQQPPKPAPADEQLPTIAVEVDLVNLLFSVRDKRGGLISNLTKEDLKVFEDGKEQQVKTFTKETDLPLTIGLLVDVSRSQENLIDVERRAASQFFSQVLRPKDMAFLISFGAEAELLQDYTNSIRLLQRGLDDLRLNAGTGGLQPGPVPTASRPRGTILYDAVYLAATDRLKGEVGRKAIVIISDGGDQGSRTTRDKAIESAHRSDAIIYSVYYVDTMFGRMYGYSGDEGALRRLSEETGGREYKVDKNHTLKDIFDQIQQEMRSQYALTYTSTNAAHDGGFRKLDIRTNNKDLKAQVRKGYYAPKS